MVPLCKHLGFEYIATIPADGNALVLICYLYISQSLAIFVHDHDVLDGRGLEEVFQSLFNVLAILHDFYLLAD